MFFLAKQTCFGLFLLAPPLRTGWGSLLFTLTLGSHVLAWIQYMSFEGKGLLAFW